MGSLAWQVARRFDVAVLGVLAASVVSALVGYAWLRAVLPREAR